MRLVSLLGVALFTAMSLSVLADDEAKDKDKKKTRGKFTIGKDTTFVNGPLDKDGYIDYVAALNERLRQGATPANNAAALLWKALGPRPEGEKMPAEFYRLMGIQAPPDEGNYFIGLSRYMKEQLKINPVEKGQPFYEELERLTQRPWTAKEHPEIAGWLKANEKPLAVVVEATKRTHYFSPLVPSRTEDESMGLISALLPGVQKCREVANALAARAMLRTAEGAADDAWQDLLACHRLGRLVGRGGTLIESLVALSLDRIACRVDIAFLDHTKPKAQRIETCLRDLQKLPPLPDMAEKVDGAERFMFLDVVMRIDRGGIKYLEQITGGEPQPVNLVGERALAGIDWDPALKNGLQWYNRMAAAMREKNRAVREQQLNDIEIEMKAFKANLDKPGALIHLVLGKPKDKGKVLGDILISMMLPAVRKVQIAGERGTQVQDNVVLAFALAWHHREHGRYPQELKALAPMYLAQVPLDLFSGKALIYRPAKNGYLLYSVGVNGKDEAGRGPDEQPPGDDLSVRLPLPEMRHK